MPAGIGLTLITWFTVILVFGLHPLVRRATNSYIFWIIYSLACIGMFLGFRYVHDVSWLINTWKSGYENVESIQISKVFLLDICPASCLAIHIVLLANPSRKIAMYIAPTCIFGGLLTITGQISCDPNASWTAQYIFYGIAPNQGYFLIHYLNVVTGTLVLCNAPAQKWTSYVYSTATLLIFFLYVAFVMICFNGKITDHVTGLLPADWDIDSGEYHVVTEILKIGWVGCLILMAIFSWGIIEVMYVPQYFIQKIQYWSIPDKKTKKWPLGFYQLNKFKRSQKEPQKVHQP